MSDDPIKRATAPMNAHARVPTQVSASAVPSTLESATAGEKSPKTATPRTAPVGPQKMTATLPMNDGQRPPDMSATIEEIHGSNFKDSGNALAPMPDEAPAVRSNAPRTLMSPAQDPSKIAKDGPPPADPRPEDAVTFAPPFPIVDHAAHARGFTTPKGVGPAGASGSPYGQGRRSMSPLVMGLVIGGVILILLALALGVLSFFVLRSKGVDPTNIQPPQLTTAPPAPSPAPPAPGAPQAAQTQQTPQATPQPASHPAAAAPATTAATPAVAPQPTFVPPLEPPRGGKGRGGNKNNSSSER
jgi:hypothetical protein